MTTLVAFIFDNEDSALELTEKLKSWPSREQIDDAAFVIRKADGAIHAEQATTLVGKGKLGGVFWGMFLAGLFWARWYDLPVGAAFADTSIEEEFTEKVGDAMRPGRSGLFALVDDAVLEDFKLQSFGMDAWIYENSFTPQTFQRFRAVFGRLD
jgi:uncharacterized membrane protein